jgi:hypothetical protein
MMIVMTAVRRIRHLSQEVGKMVRMLQEVRKIPKRTQETHIGNINLLMTTTRVSITSQLSINPSSQAVAKVIQALLLSSLQVLNQLVHILLGLEQSIDPTFLRIVAISHGTNILQPLRAIVRTLPRGLHRSRDFVSGQGLARRATTTVTTRRTSRCLSTAMLINSCHCQGTGNELVGEGRRKKPRHASAKALQEDFTVQVKNSQTRKSVSCTEKVQLYREEEEEAGSKLTVKDC